MKHQNDHISAYLSDLEAISERVEVYFQGKIFYISKTMALNTLEKRPHLKIAAGSLAEGCVIVEPRYNKSGVYLLNRPEVKGIPFIARISVETNEAWLAESKPEPELTRFFWGKPLDLARFCKKYTGYEASFLRDIGEGEIHTS